MKAKRPRSHRPSNRPDAHAATARDIDTLYGLEPVFEPGGEADRSLAPAESFYTIQCPYCGERFDTRVDPGSGTTTYIEDCQICCQPIEFDLRSDSVDGFASLSVRRSG